MTEDTILITGAAGLLGSSVVRELLRQGAKRVVASDVVGDPNNVYDGLAQVDVERCDVSSFESVLRVFDKHRPNAVYHLGAMLAPACDASPLAGIQANAMGTYYILEAARLFSVRQVLFASSIGVMNASSPEQKIIDDNCCTRPTTVYGAAKLFSENLGLTYKRLHGLDFRSLRLPALIGPYARSRGFAEWFNKSIEESVNGRPYSIFVAPRTQMDIIDVRDAARAFVQLAQAPLEQIRTVNYTVLGQSPPPSAGDLAQALNTRICGANVDFKVDDQIQQLFDHSPLHDDHIARREWGWQHQIDFEPMLDDFTAQLRAG
ncbi:NAD-dependent epimerase/dehydratase family protein [Pseudomonas sp. LB3P14]